MRGVHCSQILHTLLSKLCCPDCTHPPQYVVYTVYGLYITSEIHSVINVSSV